MATAPKLYERLPGTGYRHLAPSWVIVLLFFVIGIFALLFRGRRTQLWLGAEHLLVVEWDGYREYYKRFRYPDIQFLTVRRTPDGKYITGILGFVVFVFCVLAFVAGDPVGLTILLVIAGIIGLVLLVHVLSGPTCQCHLRTAVQKEELVSLTRVPRARKALDRLRAKIVAAQGEQSAADIYARAAAEAAALVGDAGLNAPPVIGLAMPQTPVKAPPRHYQSKVHFIFFCILLADLPFTTLETFYHPPWISVIGTLMLCLIIGFAIAALVKQQNTDLSPGLKRIPWLALTCVAVFFVLALIRGIYIGINNSGSVGPGSSSYDDPFSLTMTIISTSFTVLMGVLGLILLRRFRAAHQSFIIPPPVTEQPPPP